MNDGWISLDNGTRINVKVVEDGWVFRPVKNVVWLEREYVITRNDIEDNNRGWTIDDD